MNNALATRLRLLGSVLSVLLVVAALVLAWFYYQLRNSLPLLDGPATLEGLNAEVTVTRDDLGVPTLRGDTRSDVARSLGFLHAQERFFQMDLMRRRAAGELAAVFGRAALPIDRSTRPHRFRELARTVFAALPEADRLLLESYSAGVNSGLNALGSVPFEYLGLRTDPAAWKPEDSVLIIYAMTLDLQDAANTYERTLATLRDQLGIEAVNFFAPLITPDDASLDDSRAPLPPTPGPTIIDLRQNTAFLRLQHSPSPADANGHNARLFSFDESLPSDEPMLTGSNSFALSGAHTATGAALLANDPHLNLGLPNIWYRAVLDWGASESRQRVVGVTLPGLPFVVLGSNGHIAWGLTDAYADTNDLVAVETNAVSESLYKVPGSDDLIEIETRRDSIEIKGEPPEVVESRWTRWGPIIANDFRGRPLAHRWVAYDAAATNLNFMRLENARTATDAVTVAQDSGMPAHAFVVADRAGSIAWTIAGKFPKRVGFDGRLPVSWSFGDRRWDGYVSAAEIPTISNPASGRLWTANHRLVGGTALALLGDGGYATPPRGAQIRDRLFTLEKTTPQDFLALQRDDRALFLERWQKLLLATLTPENIAAKKSRGELRRLVEKWEGRASIDSVSYRLVKSFRTITTDLALDPIFAGCVQRMPDFSKRKFNYEPALWRLIEEKPVHLLAPQYKNWEALLLAAADEVENRLTEQGVSLKAARWGDRNRADIRHPFGRMLPTLFTSWLNLPADPLPGDVDMPLIQNPSFGASMRMVVSPGRENEALLQMPGGQSGHPLSPFYRAGHEAWVHGEPMPLLPGETRHTLILRP